MARRAKVLNPHGEALFSPERYAFYDYVSFGGRFPIVDPAYLEHQRKMREELTRRSSSVYFPVGRCAHCGTGITNHVIFLDLRDDSLIAVGETCAANRLGRDESEWRSYKEKLDAMRELARAGERRAKLRLEHPEALDHLEAALAAQQLARETLYRSQEAWIAADPAERSEAPVPRHLFEEAMAPLRRDFPRFVLDVADRLERYGKLSKAQADAVVKAVPEHRARQARYASERAAEAAASKPVPTGRVAVEGEVVSTKSEETDFGRKLKMLVRADGFKLYGTVPAALFDGSELRGRRVRFTAEVTPSRRDAGFGFFKRPTQASFVETR